MGIKGCQRLERCMRSRDTRQKSHMQLMSAVVNYCSLPALNPGRCSAQRHGGPAQTSSATRWSSGGHTKSPTTSTAGSPSRRRLVSSRAVLRRRCLSQIVSFCGLLSEAVHAKLQRTHHDMELLLRFGGFPARAFGVLVIPLVRPMLAEQVGTRRAVLLELLGGTLAPIAD